jgi:hypothetical protein
MKFDLRESLADKNRQLDILVVLGIVVYCLALWWPNRYLPVWGEGLSTLLMAAKQIADNNFHSIIAANSLQQPLWPILMAVGMKVKVGLFTSHIIVWPWLPLLMFGTYSLAKKLAGNLPAIIATFLVGVMGVVIGSYAMLSGELMTAGLVLIAINFGWLKKWRIASIVLVLAALSGELWWIGLIGIIGELILDHKERKQLKNWLWLGLPILTILVWWLYYAKTNGWHWLPINSLQIPRNIGEWLINFEFVTKRIWWNQYRWLMLIIAAGLSGYAWWQKKKLVIDNKVWQCFGLSILATLYWSLVGSFTSDKAVVVIPLITIAVCYLVWQSYLVLSNKDYEWLMIGTGVVLALIMLTTWRPKSMAIGYDVNPEINLGYQDLVMVFRQAAGYLETVNAKADIYGSKTEQWQLTQPWQGYVTGQLQFNLCNDFDFKPQETQIVYMHPYDVGQQECRKLMDQYEMKPIQRIESNSKWVELYQVTGKKKLGAGS